MEEEKEEEESFEDKKKVGDTQTGTTGCGQAQLQQRGLHDRAQQHLNAAA